jgi:4-hydroxy-tetrahydrodipicolinate synthase
MRKLSGGIWPVMLTPFSERGKIDFRGLEALTEFYISSGASGLFTNCLSSEMFQLSPEERIALTKAVVKLAADSLPVISTGTFSKDHSENVDFISRLFDQGVAAVVINSNQLCGAHEGEDVFRSHLEKLVDACGKIPLGVYECPEPYKRLLSTETIAWMAESGRFSYFKDTCCDNRQIRARLRVSRDTRFALFNANTPTGVESLRDGAAGLSPIGANFYPELYCYIHKHVQKPESPEFVRVRQFLEDYDAIVHNHYPFSAKWFLKKRGLPLTTCTRTSLPGVRKEVLSSLEILHTMMEHLLELTD